MKTKKKDELYCGVDQNKIQQAHPVLNWENLYYFRYYIIERYKIHKRKDVEQLPPPWSHNQFFKEYKFTNIRREQDRQSRYLIENIIQNDDLSYEDKIVNTIMFRTWNNWSTLRDFGFPYSAEEIYSPDLKEQIRPIYHALLKKDPNRVFWSNAYHQGGIKRSWIYANGDCEKRPYRYSTGTFSDYPDYEPDVALRPFHAGVWLKKYNIVERMKSSLNQQDCYNIICSVKGFSDFQGYQTFVDLTYIPEFPYSENEFTVAGPGCKIGIDHVFKDKDGMTYEECIFWLRNKINQPKSIFNAKKIREIAEEKGETCKPYKPMKLFDDLPEEDRSMNVMSLENCFCEFCKYMKLLHNYGRLRCKYIPYKEG